MLLEKIKHKDKTKQQEHKSHASLDQVHGEDLLKIAPLRVFVENPTQGSVTLFSGDDVQSLP